MAREGSTILDAGDFFPKLDLNLITGQKIHLPEGTGEGYGVVLFYRGYW